MRVISIGDELSKTLLKLLNTHTNFAFAVAWAGSGTRVFDELVKKKSKISKAVIGTHFYQKHPDVLDAFESSKKVMFVLQPQGVFHPKVYLFWSESSWDILVGSANLTNGAMTINNELTIHVSSKDGQEKLKEEIVQNIENYFKFGKTVDGDDVSAYREIWKKQRSSVERVSGTYFSKSKSKSPLDSSVIRMSWKDFYKQVQVDDSHGFKERCQFLEFIQEQFDSYDRFSVMPLEVRKAIAGLPSSANNYWGWFGSMRGNGKYFQAINQNNKHIGNAVDLIPRQGEISKDLYDSYIKEFVKAFPDGRSGVAISSRLLAMKRPDYFVCLDSKNKSSLCKDFGITAADMNYERYWDEIICRIQDSIWWNNKKPIKKVERLVWQSRAAMLDAIFYEE